MPVNPETGIDPEVDRFVIFRVSTNQITNMNATWPRVDGGPLVGANPDYRYYKRVVTSPPDIDHRYTLTTTQAMVDADPPAAEGHPFGTYESTYNPVKLSTADLKAQVDTEFQRQVRLQYPAVEDPARILRAADALARKQEGATLTAEQEEMIDGVKIIGDAVALLEARRLALYAAIDADEDYDITAGWQ